MSIGERLREERLRLGLSQPAFAAIAGATKSGLVKWEKDEASPNANALTAWAKAGADALYILTENRTTNPDYAEAGADLFRILAGSRTVQRTVEERLDFIRADLLDPISQPIAGENEEQSERRLLKEHADSLKAMMMLEGSAIQPELRTEIEYLLEVIENPTGLALYQSVGRSRLRNKRQELKQRLGDWFKGAEYQPGEAATYILTTLGIDFGVPTRMLVAIAGEFYDDITGSTK